MNIGFGKLVGVPPPPPVVGLSTQRQVEIHDTQQHVNLYKDKKKPFQNKLFVVI